MLKHRGIELPDSLTRRTKFYGLGWDIEKEQFKVYFRALSWPSLDRSFLELAGEQDPGRHREEALLSVTFSGTELVEKKLYLYPLEHLLPDGVQGFARMFTDRRGEVSQEDLDPKKVGAHEYNETGRKIIEAYEEIGETLDTVAYRNSEEFTLYFP